MDCAVTLSTSYTKKWSQQRTSKAKESNRIFEKSENIGLSKNQCWQDNAAVLSLNCKQSLLFDEIRRASQESSAKGKSKLPRLTPRDQ